MGSGQSMIYDIEGKPMTNRKCIVLLTPPSFQTSKFISSFPMQFSYKYVSVGQLIRDQLNKKTKYSDLIMQNLQKDKKINDKILEILLKNSALQGNFMIQFCPKDDQDLRIWEKFLNSVQIQATFVLLPKEKDEQIPTSNQIKQVYAVKLKQFRRNVRKVEQIVNKAKIHRISSEDQHLAQQIMGILPNRGQN